ncbi:hypothetical protein ETAA8_23110 [Anatilimnocola aggregata]|uniref:Uncharacterized protein n=1 Tax=Anatilimnocola aggregata TaxID=2528021 RepID=A0A517YAG7_9BACT|nr:hypothetical protein ETAA8_23110 [Anatilimnocola aggregata]
MPNPPSVSPEQSDESLNNSLRKRLTAIATGIPLHVEGNQPNLLELAQEIQAARRRSLLAHIAEVMARCQVNSTTKRECEQ